MKAHLKSLLQHAVQTLKTESIIPADFAGDIQIDRTKDAKFGDYACNLAMILAKTAKQPPRVLAEKIIAALPSSEYLAKVEIAGAGFINLFLKPEAHFAIINTILQQGEQFGRSALGVGKKIMVEFVSANPTGPLHVGHGRGAAYGAALSDLLATAGYDVHREYYVNDAGRQMDILATSVWLRYLELCGEQFKFPSNGYKGEYIRAISAKVFAQHQRRFHHTSAVVLAEIPADADAGGDKEEHIDALIARCKQLLADDYEIVFSMGIDDILQDIREDLTEFGVTYQQWFSERSLTKTGIVDRAIAQVTAQGYTYEKEGALWFKSTEFGDEKDRVLVRDNGQKTYFASDIAYHLNKYERGFDEFINIWGADHHGYIARVKAAISALGQKPELLTVLLVQFATLWQGTERMQMSTRSGEFVTLRELREDVGKDAARFFYVQRKCEQHLDFDLQLAKSQSADNPVYYIQYAHARIASVFRQLSDKGLNWTHNDASLTMLTTAHEQSLLQELARYPEVIESAARHHEPHQITYYLRDVANAFHTYYNEHKFIVDDENVRQARLSLALATRQVLQNGLKIIGVSAPEVM